MAKVMCSSLLCLMLASALEKLGLPEATGEATSNVPQTDQNRRVILLIYFNRLAICFVTSLAFLFGGDDHLWPVLLTSECSVLDHEEGGYLSFLRCVKQQLARVNLS